ncbi:MAG: hypothetical protein LBB82_10210 [Treponema sp.]|nr:hypothetical protein [Treponema sp.]
MKKVLVVICAALTLIGCASSPSSPPGGRMLFGYVLPGEYAFYLDKRGGANFYRGYLAFPSEGGANIVFVRTINLNTGKEERFAFIVKDDEKGMPTNVTNIQGEFNTLDSRQALPDFLNFTSLYLRTKNEYEVGASIDDEWDDYTLEFSFNKVLPFFQFADIKMKGKRESLYTLEYGGILNIEDASRFFEMAPLKRSAAASRRTPAIPQKPGRTVNQDAVSITLDENWKYDDSTELPGYWLSLASVRDSQIAIEKSSLKQLGITRENPYFLLKVLVLAQGNSLEMNTVKTQKTPNGYQLEFYLRDDQNTRNYQRAFITFAGDSVYVINFSSFADIYDGNRAYYNKILDSIVIGQL